jgi:hypothetical protein
MAHFSRSRLPAVLRLTALLVVIGASLVIVGQRLVVNGPQLAAAVEVAGCATLSKPPVDSPYEVISHLDRAKGSISIEIIGSSTWVADVSYTDPACLADPVLGPIIAEHLEDARVNQLSECADLIGQIASGRVEFRGAVLDIDKVKAHVEQWCQPEA